MISMIKSIIKNLPRKIKCRAKWLRRRMLPPVQRRITPIPQQPLAVVGGREERKRLLAHSRAASLPKCRPLEVGLW